MKTLLLTFGLFLLVILGMAVGYIFSKRTIKGSCGGISSLGMKKVCDCDTPCDTLQKKTGRTETARKQRHHRRSLTCTNQV